MIGFNRTRADHRQDHTELETPGQVDRARHIQTVPRRAGTRGPRRFLPHTPVVLLVQPTGQNRPEPSRNQHTPRLRSRARRSSGRFVSGGVSAGSAASSRFHGPGRGKAEVRQRPHWKSCDHVGRSEAKQAQRTLSLRRTSFREPEGLCVNARGEAWRHHVANRVYRIQAARWDHGRIAPASRRAVVAGLAEPAEATADVPICGNGVGW